LPFLKNRIATVGHSAEAREEQSPQDIDIVDVVNASPAPPVIHGDPSERHGDFAVTRWEHALVIR
jgi:hypothetical protein